MTLAKDKAETPLDNIPRPKSGTSRVENYENVKIVKDDSGDLPAQFQADTSAMQKRKTMMQALDSPKR